MSNKSKLIVSLAFLLLFIACEKEKNSIEVNMSNNVKFKDLYNKSHEFKNYTDKNKGILVFGFATWCGYSRRELINVLKIDSFYSDKLAIIGLDCSNVDDTINIKSFLKSNKITFPVSKIFWNHDFDNLLFPDSVYNFPRIVLFDKNLNKVYFQNGYLKNTVDSIAKYVK